MLLFMKEEEKAEREELLFIILLSSVAHTYYLISDYDTKNREGGGGLEEAKPTKETHCLHTTLRIKCGDNGKTCSIFFPSGEISDLREVK